MQHIKSVRKWKRKLFWSQEFYFNWKFKFLIQSYKNCFEAGTMTLLTQRHWVSTAGNTLNSANTVNRANNCSYIARYTLGIPGSCQLWESPPMGICANFLDTADFISANAFKPPIFTVHNTGYCNWGLPYIHQLHLPSLDSSTSHLSILHLQDLVNLTGQPIW